MVSYAAKRTFWILGVAVLIPSIHGCFSDSECPGFFDSSDEIYCCDDYDCCDYAEKYPTTGAILNLGISAIIGIACGVIGLIVFISVVIACCCCACCSNRNNTTGRVVAPRQTVSVVQTSAVSAAYVNPQPIPQYQTQPAYAPQASVNPNVQAPYSAAPAYPMGQQAYPMNEQPVGYKPPMPEPYHDPPPSYHS